MPIYELRSYHLRSAAAASDYLPRWAAHTECLRRIGVETLGYFLSPSDLKTVVAVVRYPDGADPEVVIPEYLDSECFKQAMAGFDASQLKRVDAVALEPRAAVSGKQGRLAEKIALITGGARGQGEAEARLFAGEGSHVFICDVLVEAGEKLAAELRAAGLTADFRALDVTDADRWSCVVADIESQVGRLDVLVNNAGVNVRHQLTATTSQEWDTILDVNLKGQLIGIQACAALMKRTGNGSIINVGSTAGIMGHPVAAYTSSKWGVRGLTKAAAVELAPSGIRVNAIHPGVVDTQMMDAESTLFAELIRLTPLGRAAAPAEMAAAALFLASDESRFITGIDLAVDGGFSELATYADVWKRLNSHHE